MRKFLFYPLICLLILPGLSAAEVPGEDPSGGVPKPEVDLPFPVGEVLEYTIYWGWIGVGTSHATTSWKWVDDRWMISIRFRTRTSGIAERLYSVDDNVETLIDAETLKPIRFTTVLKAGSEFRDEETVFDWENMKAHYTRRRRGDREDEHKSYPIQPETRDLVSFMYFMRKTDFEENEKYEFEVVVNDKLYELEVNSREYERVNLANYGRIRSLRMDPRASFEGVFVRRGEMVVWISEDERRILTKMEADTPFANIKLLLRNVRGPGEDDWIKNAEKD